MSEAIPRRTFCGAAAASALTVGLPSAHAASFPDRPLKLIVGFAPGGPTDAVAREFARRLEREIGQPVVVDNRPGAVQTVAMQAAISSGADGYTLIIGNPGRFSVGPKMYRIVSYDSSQFVPLTPLTTQASVLVASSSFPASSFTELINLAKTRKEPINYASVGVGSSMHLAMEIFKKKSGLSAQHIPYKGEAPALMALLGKEIELGALTMFGAMPRIRSGELKALGVLQAVPDPSLPQVQTTAQAGYPDVDVTSWLGLFAPPKTPKDVTDRLETAARRVQNSTEFAAYVTGNGMHPLAIENKAFVAMIQKQTRQMGEIIDAIALKPE